MSNNKCSVCEIEFDTLNNKKRDLRNCSEQKNKLLCSKCSDISPAHIFYLINNNLTNFDKVESRLNNLEKINEYVANSIKTLINSYNTIEQISDEVLKIFNKFDKIEEQCISGCNKLEELLNNFNKNNKSVKLSLETLADVSSRLEDNWVTNSSNLSNQRDSHVNSNDLPKFLFEVKSINNKLDDLKKSKLNFTKSTAIVKKDVAIETDSVISVPQSSVQISYNGGWRNFGEKKIWKSDWSHYDEKMQRYKKSENHRIKQRKQKQKRKQQKAEPVKTKQPKKIAEENRDTNFTTFNRHSSLRRTIRKTTDSTNNPPTLTSIAPLNESVTSLTTNESQKLDEPANQPTSNNVVPKNNFNFINFQKGENLHANSPTQSFIDPLMSPTVKLTQMSANVNGRYVLSRLNEPKIYHILRNYIGYLHDQPASVFHEGMNCISSKVHLGSEGLPTDVISLRKLLDEYNARYDFTPKDTQMDLDAIRSYCHTIKINNIQRARENHNKFYLGKSNTNKNF